MVRDLAAYKRRKKIFDQIKEMDWEKIDNRTIYQYRKDRLAKARELKFKYISECTVKLYKKYWSYRKAARDIGVTPDSIRCELIKFGIKLQPRGGWRPGDKRDCARFQYWDDKIKTGTFR